MISYLIVCPLLFLAGLVDSIAGGGGLISLPAYVFTGIPMHLAIGTNKLSSTMGTTISTARYLKNGYIRGGIMIRIALLSVVASLAGSTIGSSLSMRMSEQVLKNLMIPILLVTAFYVLRNKNLGDVTARKPLSDALTTLVAIAAAFVIGTYDGIYGPGTGTFLILVLTGVARLEIRKAAALTKVINLASNVAALTNFLINGNVNYRLGLVAGCFCIAGNYLGAGLVIHNGQRFVRPLVMMVLVILFIKIISGM